MPGSCFLISNLDCSERDAVCCIPLQICESVSRRILFMESKTSSSSGAVGENCFLLDHSEAGVTNGNGERLNFPALSGSRQVAGSKVNSLPSLDKINVFVMEMQSVTRDSHQELQWTQIHQVTPHPYHHSSSWPGSPGSWGRNFRVFTSTDIWIIALGRRSCRCLKVFNMSGFFLARRNPTWVLSSKRWVRSAVRYLFIQNWLIIYVYLLLTRISQF